VSPDVVCASNEAAGSHQPRAQKRAQRGRRVAAAAQANRHHHLGDGTDGIAAAVRAPLQERAAAPGVGFTAWGCADGASRSPGPWSNVVDGQGRGSFADPRAGVQRCCPCPSSPSLYSAKSRQAPSSKTRGGRTPLEQRSGSKPLEPSAQRRPSDPQGHQTREIKSGT